MPIGGANLLRERIRAALVGCAGRSTIAAATAISWRLVTEQLSPVIGTRGFDVLFNRALHQTSAAFPWLVGALDQEGVADPMQSLLPCLGGQPTEVATEASCALLVRFAELLATLIGESLTIRLLAPVWASPLLSSRQEPSS